MEKKIIKDTADTVHLRYLVYDTCYTTCTCIHDSIHKRPFSVPVPRVTSG